MIPSTFAIVALLTCPVQDTQKEIDELKKRIESLEKKDQPVQLQDDSGDLATKLGSLFTIYGFLRLDMHFDTSETNDTQTTMFVISDDVLDADESEFTLYPRLTRLGLQFDGGTIDDTAKLTGKIEVDFFGGGSDSRSLFRMRKAYLKLAWDEFEILAGQDSDTYSPLYPSNNADMLNWGIGNPGDRRTQLRFSYLPHVGEGTLSAKIALAVQGAVDAQNTDAATPDTILDGEESGVPQLQLLVGYKGPWFVEETDFEVSVWFVRGSEETETLIAGEDEFDSSLFGLSFHFPIMKDTLWVKGEIWAGENGDDLRIGIGQGINGATGAEIESDGGWVEVSWKPVEWDTVFLGYSFDDPDDGDVPAGGREKNRIIYLGTSITKWDPVVVGFEYWNLETEWSGLDDGTNHRVKLYIMYKF